MLLREVTDRHAEVVRHQIVATEQGKRRSGDERDGTPATECHLLLPWRRLDEVQGQRVGQGVPKKGEVWREPKMETMLPAPV